MQESARTTGLWFSPDYTPDYNSAIQLPPAKPGSISSSISASPGEDELKILIWSNSGKEAEYIQNVLKQTGYSRLWHATSYEEGLEKMQAHLFDFFIIDLTIDGIGTQLVKALRSSVTYRNTPMLICTESQLIQDMLKAMKAGANDLICKPINAGLLKRKIALHSKMRYAA